MDVASGAERGYDGAGTQLGPGQDLPPLLLDDEEAIVTAPSSLEPRPRHAVHRA